MEKKVGNINYLNKSRKMVAFIDNDSLGDRVDFHGCAHLHLETRRQPFPSVCVTFDIALYMCTNTT